jgi:hypothetical protein
VGYPRFTPDEDSALCHHCRPLDLDACPPHKLKRLLVGWLAATLPGLAVRVAGFRPPELLLLREHLRRRTPTPEAGHGLTEAEVRAVAEACGPVLLQARFLGPFQRALVEFLKEESPALAGKVGRLGRPQFELLCGEVKGLLGRPR